jgi:hypothetical protein
MKKVLKVSGIVLLVIVLGYVGFAATRPDTYHVERSRLIAASPEVIQPQIEDLRQWVEWNPWDAMDPDMHKEFSDPSSGRGAWYSWRGNDQVGIGRMEITEAAPSRVVYHLAFQEPFQSESEVTITYAAEGEGTRVTWAMDGSADFTTKLFTALMDWDSMIGPDFERGLSNLDERVTE